MDKIEPKNLTAQVTYVARGNPPGTELRSAIANCFPGLEFDFRNVWKHFLVGIELHESLSLVVKVDEGSKAAAAGVTTRHSLINIGGFPTVLPRINSNGQQTTTPSFLEWTNSLAEIINGEDKKPECRFEILSQNIPSNPIIVELELRALFTDAVISEEVAAPGALTQGLCSPWQADYRECGCFYWAASRPDYVNVEIEGDEAKGHHWLDKERVVKEYIPDRPENVLRLVSYEDLYRDWEKALKFQIEGKDE